MDESKKKLTIGLLIYLVFSLVFPYMNGLASRYISGETGISRYFLSTAAAIVIQVIVAAISIYIIKDSLARPKVKVEKTAMETLASRRSFMFVILMTYSAFLFAHGIAGFIEAQDAAVRPVSLIYLIYAVLITPISEELLFRGVLYGSIREIGGAVPAAVFSTAMFAVAHGDISQAAVVVVIGLVFAFIYEMFGDLLIVILLHAVHNALAILYPKALVLAGESVPVRLLTTVLAGAAAVYLAVRIYQIRKKSV